MFHRETLLRYKFFWLTANPYLTDKGVHSQWTDVKYSVSPHGSVG